MEIIKPQENQSVFDMALQEYGSLEGLFDLLDDNAKIQVDGALSVYEDLKIEQAPVRREIKEFYRSRTLLPATGATQAQFDLLEEPPMKPEGIGYMEVENDFIVCPPRPIEIEGSLELRGTIQVTGTLADDIILNGIVAYRPANTNATFQFVNVTDAISDALTFTMQVLPDTNYEVVALTDRFSAQIEVSTPIDQSQSNRNVFNAATALQTAAQNDNFTIRLFIANQPA